MPILSQSIGFLPPPGCCRDGNAQTTVGGALLEGGSMLRQVQALSDAFSSKEEATRCAMVVLRTMVASSRRLVVRGGTSAATFSWLPCSADLR